MKLLLDTHVLIWWLKHAERIRPQIRTLIAADTTEVFISAVTAWEIAYKVRLGKLAFEAAFLEYFRDSVVDLAFVPLEVSHAHAVMGAQLAGDHRDPFDRLLAGQASCDGLNLVSADEKFKLLGIEPLW